MQLIVAVMFWYTQHQDRFFFNSLLAIRITLDSIS
jgi:hypothetical protein